MIDLSTVSTADLISELSSRTISGHAPVRAEIVAFTAHAFNVSVVDLLSRERTQHLSIARTVAMALCREFTECSLQEIGHYFSRDHGTIIHAIKRLSVIESKPDYANLVRAIRSKLASSDKVSKTSVHSADNSTEFLKSDPTTFSGYLQP